MNPWVTILQTPLHSTYTADYLQRIIVDFGI